MGRTKLETPQCWPYKYVITALCNDVRMPGHIQSALRACCSKYLNPHPLLLPQSPTSVSKPLILKLLLWTDGCQHSKISFIATRLGRNMSSLTQLRECPEYEKKSEMGWPNCTTQSQSELRTWPQIMSVPLLLSWALQRLKGDWVSFKQHKINRATQRWQDKREKKIL